MTQEIRSYDYVNAPYAQVREILLEEPRRLFQRATAIATTRAQALRIQLQGARLREELPRPAVRAG
jgi:hypothetical protein